MDYYSFIVVIHIIAASAFVMTLIIMQLVVSNVMKRIPDSQGKQEGVNFIQKRWIPIVEIIIVIVGISALGIAIINYEMILNNKLFIIKIIFGIIALSSAYINHFYLKYAKKRLLLSGENKPKLIKITKIMPILNKVALIGASITALFGWYLNHIS